MTSLTPRQWRLANAATARSSSVEQQILLLTSLARTVAASQKDVEAVRAHLLRGRVKECRG